MEARVRRILMLAVSVMTAAGTLPAFAAEATRTLHAELTLAPGQVFAVENLAGTMRVVAGEGDAVVAVATVHAESQVLADAVRLERVTGTEGRPALRVRYPLDQHWRIRYPGAPDSYRERSRRWFDGGRTSAKYDGHDRVQVSHDEGVLVYADLEVRVPRRSVDAVFRNVVGPLVGEGVDGRVRFETGSGTIDVQGSKGDLTADTGSGDVTAQSVEGKFTCDTGSGRCEVAGFRGESLRCDTGSGDVEVRGAAAGRIAIDTGSGDVCGCGPAKRTRSTPTRALEPWSWRREGRASGACARIREAATCASASAPTLPSRSGGKWAAARSSAAIRTRSRSSASAKSWAIGAGPPRAASPWAAAAAT